MHPCELLNHSRKEKGQGEIRRRAQGLGGGQAGSLG